MKASIGIRSIATSARVAVVFAALLCLSAGNAVALPAGPPQARAAGQEFDLPDDDEIVVWSLVDNGPVAPDAQTWYEIEIDAGGHAEAEFTPEGASPDLDEPAAEQERWRYDLDEDGLQGLLVVLDDLGFFDLPPSDEVDVPEGAGADLLRVTLAEEAREVYAIGLDEEEAARFASIQTAIAAATGVDQFPTALF
jgi:hypothetical protein